MHNENLETKSNVEHMKDFKVKFAYTNKGEIIDVVSAEKQTDYYCACGGKVRLRGGDVISDHFYHLNDNTGCSEETVLHKVYKEVFKEEKKIILPTTYNNQDILEFDEVYLEKTVGDFIPDAIGIKGGEKFLIEFAYSSFIGERKLKKIKKLNAFCMEVHISQYKSTIEEIRKDLTSDTFMKHIVHYPSLSKDLYELKKELEKISNKYNITQTRVNELEIKIKKEKELNNYLNNALESANSFEREYGDVIHFITKTHGCKLKFIRQLENGAAMYMSKQFIAFVDDRDSLNFKVKNKKRY